PPRVPAGVGSRLPATPPSVSDSSIGPGPRPCTGGAAGQRTGGAAGGTARAATGSTAQNTGPPPGRAPLPRGRNAGITGEGEAGHPPRRNATTCSRVAVPGDP